MFRNSRHLKLDSDQYAGIECDVVDEDINDTKH